MLQNENINSVIESSIKFNDTLNELLIKVYSLYSENNQDPGQHSVENSDEEMRKMNAMTAIIADQCISLKYVLDEFFLLLKNELKPRLNRVKKTFKDSETSAAFTESSTSSEDSDEHDENDFDNEFAYGAAMPAQEDSSAGLGNAKIFF